MIGENVEANFWTCLFENYASIRWRPLQRL